MEAMVDSGAKNSAVSEEWLVNRSCFEIRPPSNYRSLDGMPINNVVGETALTVRYQGVVVDLPRVAVVKKMLYPLVLGIEWIVQSGAVIKGVEGKAEVIMPDRSPVSSVHPKKEEEDTLKTEENLSYEEATKELKNLCLMAKEEEMPSSEDDKEQSVVLKTLHSSIVPANSAGYFKCRVPNDSSKFWMVSTAGAVGAKGGWVTPNCVVEVEDGVLIIPVVNVNPHAISRKSAKGVLKAVPVRESEIYPFESEDTEASVVANFQSDDGLPAYTDTLDDVKIDGSLTPEQEKLTSPNTTSIQEMRNLFIPYLIAYRWQNANLSVTTWKR
ncbi:hypothetical protein DAPPUDRAFT_119627 [Daphnia pulex]|uniref:Uncharacterized protein n=1 Tax=Daphnia pulex TaxID=6669 RepID=E9HZ26_DAPPU|nr:hypothetical protein DAPPUDRAFT_119627 [Daphnia pulex]|eukprot:EFX63006.1 hypothetical protein DAPPUDRAFT_119627 [Daphnia pulex]